MVNQAIGQDELARRRKATEDGGIRRIAAAPEQAEGKSVPGAQLFDQPRVRPAPAGDERRGRSRGSVPDEAAAAAAATAGSRRQVEIVVVRQIEASVRGFRHP